MSTRLDLPITYLITSGDATPKNFHDNRTHILSTIRTAVECGVSLVQVREKKLSARALYSLVSDAMEITRTSSTRLLVNDRADIAVAAGADGVHLTTHSIPAAVIRRIFGGELMIGVSAHSGLEIEHAVIGGADFAVFGPVFASPGKGKPVGVEELSSVCKAFAPFPVLALGGVDETNYQIVLNAGASGFAAIRFLNDEGNLRLVAESLRMRRG